MALSRQPQPQDASATRKTGCLWAFVVFQSLTIVTLLLILAVYGALDLSLGVHGTESHLGADEFPDLTEVWSYGSGDTKVVDIPLTGVIMLEEQDGYFSRISGTALAALMSIRRATHDPDVKAIILSVDSGGGGITASDILYDALLEFKAHGEDRHVVALLHDVAASGAYYVSLAADHIIAHPTTVTGSIGVLIQSLNFRELAQKIGVKDVTIKSGRNKDLLNPFGDLGEEQRAMLQEVVDDMHSRFVRLVAENRHLPEETVRGFSDGRVFGAARALEMGVIDEIGYRDVAMHRTAELLNVEDIMVIRYHQEFSLASFLRGMSRADLLRTLMPPDAGTPQLLYRWSL